MVDSNHVIFVHNTVYIICKAVLFWDTKVSCDVITEYALFLLTVATSFYKSMFVYIQIKKWHEFEPFTCHFIPAMIGYVFVCVSFMDTRLTGRLILIATTDRKTPINPQITYTQFNHGITLMILTHTRTSSMTKEYICTCRKSFWFCKQHTSKRGHSTVFLHKTNSVMWHFYFTCNIMFKGCGSYFQICTWIALEHFNNNDQPVNRHDFLISFNFYHLSNGLWLVYVYFKLFMCVKSNSLFDREVKVCYGAQVLKQCVKAN